MTRPGGAWRLRLNMPDQGRLEQAAWYGAAVVGVAAVTLLIGLARSHVPPERLQISYLLVVLALAIGGGSGPAIAASLLAFLAYDWFFVQPIGTPIVEEPAEWLALGLFVVVAVATGSLAAGLKRSAEEERRRTREIATLYDLSIAVLAGRQIDRVLGVITQRLHETLALPALVLLADGDGDLRVAAQTGLPEQLAALGLPAVARESGDAAPPAIALRPAVAALDQAARACGLHGMYRPLRADDRLLGLLAVFAPAGDAPPATITLRTVDAFAAQAALAIERARLAEEEERARAAAESDRQKSLFLASLSHDLRTPLTAIKAAAGVLSAETNGATAMDAVSCIDHEVDRLNRLVGNLLELSRIEGGGLPPTLVPEDLAEVVGATVERLGPLFDGRPVELRAADLPLVAIDAMQIERVLVNLLENAIRFSPPLSPITVELTATRDQAIVRVHNLGAPIAPRDQQRIFEKFHRLRSEAPAVDGAGLGLAICKGIVEAHGGRIWTRNENAGVAFYVALPAATDAARRELVRVAR